MKNIYTKKNLEKLYLIRLVEEEIARRYKKEKNEMSGSSINCSRILCCWCM